MLQPEKGKKGHKKNINKYSVLFQEEDISKPTLGLKTGLSG